MLDNIDSSSVRPEYKVKVYTKYLLNTIKFMLTVHDLTKTQRAHLDQCCTKLLKKWLGMPNRGATSAIIHSKQGLNIPLISQVYSECHAQAAAHCRLRADERVQTAMDACIAREKNLPEKVLWKCESSGNSTGCF